MHIPGPLPKATKTISAVVLQGSEFQQVLQVILKHTKVWEILRGRGESKGTKVREHKNNVGRTWGARMEERGPIKVNLRLEHERPLLSESGVDKYAAGNREPLILVAECSS